MTAPGPLHRLLARVVRASVVVDRGFRLFDRLRSRLVVALGNDRFFTAFNDVTYGAQDRYRPDRGAFKPELYDWERRIVRRTFPPPPARILIGGAGGGREAIALARMGYRVVAFDRAQALVDAMADAVPSEAPVEPLLGAFQDLPVLRRPHGGAAVDLSKGSEFDAAIFGWGSFSHLPMEDRLGALENVGRLTGGPILVSFLPRPAGQTGTAARAGVFSVQVGFYREASVEEVAALGNQAGLEAVPLGDDQESAFVVLRRPIPS